MLKRLNLALGAAVLVFGAAASSPTQAHAFYDTRCGGNVKPLCRTVTTERCVSWYVCGFFERCCRTWDRITVNEYFPGGGDDYLPEPE